MAKRDRRPVKIGPYKGPAGGWGSLEGMRKVFATAAPPMARTLKALSRPLHTWFEEMIDSGVDWAAIPPAVLLDSSFLPGAPPRDPADRIIAATARAYRYRVMTRDRALLDYGAAGNLEVIAC